MFHSANFGDSRGDILYVGKGKVRTLDSASSWGNLATERSGMARVVKGSHSFTCHSRVYS